MLFVLFVRNEAVVRAAALLVLRVVAAVGTSDIVPNVDRWTPLVAAAAATTPPSTRAPEPAPIKVPSIVATMASFNFALEHNTSSAPAEMQNLRVDWFLHAVCEYTIIRGFLFESPPRTHPFIQPPPPPPLDRRLE